MILRVLTILVLMFVMAGPAWGQMYGYGYGRGSVAPRTYGDAYGDGYLSGEEAYGASRDSEAEAMTDMSNMQNSKNPGVRERLRMRMQLELDNAKDMDKILENRSEYPDVVGPYGYPYAR